MCSLRAMWLSSIVRISRPRTQLGNGGGIGRSLLGLGKSLRGSDCIYNWFMNDIGRIDITAGQVWVTIQGSGLWG